MARKVKVPDFISTPKDPGWVDKTYPAKELTNKQVFVALQKSGSRKKVSHET